MKCRKRKLAHVGCWKTYALRRVGHPTPRCEAAGVSPEGTLVTTRLALSEQDAAERIGVWRAPAGCRTESTTAVGADVLNVSPNSAAEYDRGLGVPTWAALLVSSQCEPVATRS